MESNQDKEEFFHPRYPYRGEVKPENIVFNANLQEFAQEVS
ncbi:MAG: citramalate synthase, partial [Crocosphaera sp.]